MLGNLARKAGNVLIGAVKHTIPVLKTVSNVVIEKTKNFIVSNIPLELQEAIKQGKLVIPKPQLISWLKFYLLQQKLNVDDLLITPNQCLIIGNTKKIGANFKFSLGINIANFEFFKIKKAETEVSKTEMNISLIVVQPLEISSDNRWGKILIWLQQKIKILGIDLLPENLKNISSIGDVITLSSKDFTLSKEYENYMQHGNYAKEIKFVDHAVEIVLEPPQWIVEKLTEEKQESVTSNLDQIA